MSAVPISMPLARSRAHSVSLPSPLALAAFTLYLGLGAYLAFVLHAYDRDAYSRVGNAYYVLFSRDPHLAAIGFVWMPLPSLFELALLPAKFVFPALVEQGFAAVIMSATFGALAVVTLSRILVELGLRRWSRLALVAAFALHPMVVYYSAIGTSEAPTLFFALYTCLYLLRYVRTSSTMSLVGVGFGLAGGYLTRYEAGAAAVGVAGLILLLALTRLTGSMRNRLMHAAADIAIGTLPFVLVFVGWAVASWVIVGSPFSQFTSQYGNTSQMLAGGGGGEGSLSYGQSVGLASIRLLTLSIAAPVGAVAALWIVGVRRDPRSLAVVAVFGPVVAFMVLAYVLHLTAPWLRYYILIIPFGILLLGCALAPREPSTDLEAARPAIGPPRRVSWAPGLPTAVAPPLIIAAALLSIPIASIGLFNPVIASEEARDIPPLLGSQAAAPDRPGDQIESFAGENAIAAYVDSMDLARGSVLIDAFLGFPIILQSHHPERFVITADRDFRQSVSDPAAFNIRYLLVPPGGGNASLDAINRTYPNLASDRAFASAIHVFPAVGPSPSWTLYALVAVAQ